MTIATKEFHHFNSGAVRNPLQQPFASTSPWNMPIGTGAVYVNANMPGYGPNNGSNFTQMPQVDPERIVLAPAAPQVTIAYSNVGWGGGNRCAPTGGSNGGLPVTVPVPATYTVPNSNKNECAAFLLADGRTITQVQPLALCTAGGNGTSIVAYPNVDLYGPGITGAHGGSGLSVVGGSIRLGELRPGQTGMRHTVKIDVDDTTVLAPQTLLANTFRWPADRSDSGALASYGSANPGQYSGMRMGALMAIPQTVNLATLGLVSAPGLQLAWTLQNYGAYIVDSCGAQYEICAEDGPAGSKNAEFLADWGYPLDDRIASNTPWTNDFQKCMTALWLVDNNTSGNVGGGGTPLQPLAPAI